MKTLLFILILFTGCSTYVPYDAEPAPAAEFLKVNITVYRTETLTIDCNGSIQQLEGIAGRVITLNLPLESTILIIDAATRMQIDVFLNENRIYNRYSNHIKFIYN